MTTAQNTRQKATSKILKYNSQLNAIEKDSDWLEKKKIRGRTVKINEELHWIVKHLHWYGFFVSHAS